MIRTNWLCIRDCSGEIDISVELLTEIDKLVQLLESPIFICEYLPVTGTRF